MSIENADVEKHGTFGNPETNLLTKGVVGSFTALGPILASDFVIHTGGYEEVLRIAKDGFYVRGVKLEQDEHEARRLFDAFTEFLAGARR